MALIGKILKPATDPKELVAFYDRPIDNTLFLSPMYRGPILTRLTDLTISHCRVSSPGTTRGTFHGPTQYLLNVLLHVNNIPHILPTTHLYVWIYVSIYTHNTDNIYAKCIGNATPLCLNMKNAIAERLISLLIHHAFHS